MTDPDHDPDVNVRQAGINSGYAAFQIAKVLATSEQHDDPATRERAQKKIAKWEAVLRNILSGAVDYGSRTPVDGVPGWATLEVVTGGFATGGLLAGGPIREDEKRLLGRLREVPDGTERRTLNGHFLTDRGLSELQERLRTACYDVGVPEEAALMVVAWLVENGYAGDARELIDSLSPFFGKLRFYPLLLDQPKRFGYRVHVQEVGNTIEDLRKIKPNERVLAQKEAVEIWVPLYDRIVALFLETVEDGWPCRTYPAGRRERAAALLREYAQLRGERKLCRKPERIKGHFAQLRELLARSATNPRSLTGRDVGRIRLILARYVEKRGVPNSLKCAEARRRQLRDVGAATFHEIVRAILPRLERHSKSEGLDDVSHLTQALNKAESASSGLPEGTAVPVSIQRKIERCLNETVTVLVERGLITSGEGLARVLRQMISEIRSAGLSDPMLRRLYAAIYRAFRRRRSLLLLNLEKQIEIEELPWVAAIDRFRDENLSSCEQAKQTLHEVTVLTITSFPHAILPNKLLQELRALAKGADLTIPLVDEVAADIFMGRFSGKFLESAKRAADLLDRSLYATYYGIDYEEIRRIPEANPTNQTSFLKTRGTEPEGFVQLCASRAGVPLGTWNPTTNGMIIEQQQILTTQNLAPLFASLDLIDVLRDQLVDLAKLCFRWICKRHQMKTDKWHARLIMIKNTAYAWRQMVFFLALLPDRSVADLLVWAEDHFSDQSEEFRIRFRPALKGLVIAADGGSIDNDSARRQDVRRVLGWSKERHWLLTNGHTR
jgi:hypothetical protein